MMRKIVESRVFSVAIIATLIFFSPYSFAAHENDDQKAVIRIAVLAYKGKAAAVESWQAHINFLNERLPKYEFQLVPLSYTNDELNNAVRNHDVDFVITNPGNYIELELEGHIAHMATRRMRGPAGILSNFGGTAITQPNRDDITRYDDLDGKTILIPSKSSLGGWYVHLREALEQGIDLQKRAEIVQLNEHQEVVKAIIRGEGDVGFIRSDLLEQMAEKGEINIKDIRVVNQITRPDFPYLLSTRLYPEWPFSMVHGTPNNMAVEVLRALLEINPQSRAAQNAGIYDWTISSDYRMIDELLFKIGLGPYANIKLSTKEMIKHYWVEHSLSIFTIFIIIILSLTRFVFVNHRLVREISRRRHAEQDLRRTASVFENANEGIVITDPSAIIIDVNKAFTTITGYKREEIIGENPSILNSHKQDASFYEDMWTKLQTHGVWKGEIWNRKKSGEIYAELLTISAVYAPDGTIEHYVGIFFDITNIKEQESLLHHLAHHDALTKLPNRILFYDRLEQSLARTKRQKDLLAIAYLDLDGFKPVNDSLGHEAGDKLLIDISRRLKLSIREDDTVARIGGDEFAVLLASITTFEECELAVERILRQINIPFTIGENEINISASIGITIFPLDDSTPDILLRHADQAMYIAKQSGRNQYYLYNTILDNMSDGISQQLEKVRLGLKENEFALYYQPIIDLNNHQIAGFEILIRWHHPKKGLLLPSAFINEISKSDLTIEFEGWIIEQSFKQLSQWNDQNLYTNLYINLSSRYLLHNHLIEFIKEMLRKYPRVNAQQIRFEIVEDVTLEDHPKVRTIIEELNLLNIPTILDDFGTGYSSITYVKSIPVHTIKIEQQIVQGMMESDYNYSLVDGIIGLANAYHYNVIAEGAESMEHCAILKSMGCNLVQGYGISEPLHQSDVLSWVSDFENNFKWEDQLPSEWRTIDAPLLLIQQNHVKWINQLLNYLSDAVESSSIIPAINHKQCFFGRWFYSHGMKKYQEVPEFMALEPVHHQIHNQARLLLSLKKEGRVSEMQREIENLLKLKEQLLSSVDTLLKAIKKNHSNNSTKTL